MLVGRRNLGLAGQAPGLPDLQDPPLAGEVGELADVAQHPPAVQLFRHRRQGA